MLRPLSAALARAVFGNRNNHGFMQVAAWRAWRAYAKTKYPLRCEPLPFSGIQVLGQSNVDDLASIVEGLLSGESITDGYSGLPRKKNPLVAPMIFDVLNQHKALIENFYGSYFRVNWFEVQKIVEGYVAPNSGSFAYHTDDGPDGGMKVFIYLNDTVESSGAFRAFDYRITDRLIRAGILKSASPGAPRADAQKLVSKDLEKELVVVEGKKGTVFMFDNNLIHKGTLPRLGTRIHISMEIVPSIRPLNYAEFSKDCDQPIREYFPRNPFRLLRSK